MPNVRKQASVGSPHRNRLGKGSKPHAGRSEGARPPRRSVRPRLPEGRQTRRSSRFK